MRGRWRALSTPPREEASLRSRSQAPLTLGSLAKPRVLWFWQQKEVTCFKPPTVKVGGLCHIKRDPMRVRSLAAVCPRVQDRHFICAYAPGRAREKSLRNFPGNPNSSTRKVSIANRFRRLRMTQWSRVRAPARAREIIEEFFLEMPQRVLPEKCQWRYRLLMSGAAETIQTLSRPNMISAKANRSQSNMLTFVLSRAPVGV